MSGKMLLTTRLDHRLLMNQQLKQVIGLLQYSTIELKQQIKQIIETNFIFEIDDAQDSVEESSDAAESDDADEMLDDGYGSYPVKSVSNNVSDDYLENIAQNVTLRQYLLEQTLSCHFNEEEQRIAEAIIDALDDGGYLSMTLDEISTSLNGTSVIKILSVLKIIQGFEPRGVAARNTQECLLIQLDQLGVTDEVVRYARLIVETNLLTIDEFDIVKVEKLTGLSEEQIKEGLGVIKNLDFHPGRQFSDGATVVIEPELYVKKVKNDWKVFLADSMLTRLSINKSYKKIIKDHSRDKDYKSISEQLKEAHLIINGLRRRNETLLTVGTYIMQQQVDFLNNGNDDLKPMNMADVAAVLECHESTISRITSGKYIKTPHGIFELKYFFPSQLKSANGGAKSSVAVKEMIRDFIASETSDAAYSDDDLASMIKEKGIQISRRTVAKYREAMNIPSSYLRVGMNLVKSKMTDHQDDLEQSIQGVES